jgi:predicted HicB family RNase H-like nuclease
VDGFFLLYRYDTSGSYNTFIEKIGALKMKEIMRSRNPHSAILNRRFGMATINLRNVPDDLHRKAKARAAMEGVTLKQLIMRLLEEYLDGVC